MTMPRPGAMPRLLPSLTLVLALATSSLTPDPAAASDAPRPWETAARLTVDRGKLLEIGSGTVIDSTPERSIVLSCAHIFSKSAIGSAVKVDLFDGTMTTSPAGGPGRLAFRDGHAGRLLAIDPAADLSLVEFRPGRVLDASPVAPEGVTLVAGQPLTAVGCGNGGAATVWSTTVLGTAGSWTVCKTRPLQGRSGGGLFDLDDRVVGVCDFASVEQDAGLYAPPSAIRSLLMKSAIPAQCDGRRVCLPPTPIPQPRPAAEPGLRASPTKAPAPATPTPPASQAPAVTRAATPPADHFALLDANLPEWTHLIAMAAGVGVLFAPSPLRRRSDPAHYPAARVA